MATKKNTTKRNEGLYLEDQLHNLIYSDKVFSMIARVIEDKFEEQLEEKVKTYCQKFINKEIDKEQKFFGHQSQKLKQNDCQQKVFFPRKVERIDTTKKSCKRCGKTPIPSKSKEKRQINFNNHESYELQQNKNLIKVKSNELKTVQKYISVMPESKDRENNKIFKRKEKLSSDKQKDQDITKFRSKSAKSNIYIVNKSLNSSQGLKIQVSLVEKTQQNSLMNKKKNKLKKVLKNLEDSECANIGQVEKIVNDNLNLRSKEIAKIIKQMNEKAKEKISPILNNFEVGEENCRFNRTTIYPNIIEEYQNMSLDEMFMFKRNKNGKEKQMIFRKMLQLFKQANRTQLYKFIQKNEKLSEKQLIEKWTSQTNQEDFEYMK